MKKMICASLLVLAASNAMAEARLDLEMDQYNDGQILSVSGYKNMMPMLRDPSMPAPPADAGAKITIKFAAISGGCTSAESFKVELKKLNSKTYVATATRTQVDPCEAVPRVVILEKSVMAPLEVFSSVGSNKARILAEPHVSVGIAY